MLRYAFAFAGAASASDVGRWASSSFGLSVSVAAIQKLSNEEPEQGGRP